MKYPRFNEAGLTDKQVELIRDCMSQANGLESKINDHYKEIVIYDNGGRALILKIVKSGFQFNVWFRAPNAQKVDKPYKRLKEYLLSRGANDWRFNSAGMELVAQNKGERNGEDRGNVLYFWPQDDTLRTKLSGEEIYNRRVALGALSKLILEKLKEVNYFTVDYSALPLTDASGDKDDYDKPEVANPQKKSKLDSSLVDKVLVLVKDALNVVLTGAPGTGKTYTAREVAKEMVGAKLQDNATEDQKEEAKKAEEDRIESVQFHPGYDYSDFVIGMKPKLIGERGKEQVSFDWQEGIFKAFADKAKDNPAHNYVFLIDEINRADLSRVFGELFSLLEEEYRYFIDDDGNPHNEKGITLPNGKTFVIPKNLYIIGTMNDIDRSVESMDFALRRRFAWYEVTADMSEGILDAVDENGIRKVSKPDSDLLKKAMGKLNAIIGGKEFEVTDENGSSQNCKLRLGSEYQLGGAIFAKLEKYVKRDSTRSPQKADEVAFDKLWNNHIENILLEYLRGQSNRTALLKGLKQVFDDAVKGIDKQGESGQTGDSATVDKNSATDSE